MTINSSERIFVAGNADTPANLPRNDQERALRQAADKARERLKGVFGVQELLPLAPLSSHYPSAENIGYLLPTDETD